jgi:hypothetical protein
LLLEVLEGRTAPAVFTVNTFDDTVEANRDGSGLDAAGNTSLRSAVMATNDLGGSNTIVLSAGTYNLTIAPVQGGGDEGGHLNIGRGFSNNNLTITGATDGATIIDANNLDHAVDVGFFCSATLSQLTIQNGTGIFGGDIGNSGHLTIDSSTITGGTATFGGGIFSAGGTVTITNSTIANNTATPWGGGIYNQAATITLTNDTIANNSATEGGGIFTFGFGATITLTNCTIAGNSCTGFDNGGGGIYHGIGNPTTVLKNTIVATNTADQGPDIDGAITSQGHNLIGNSQDASGFVDSDFVGTADNPIDPMLGPLQDNGGPTQTMALQQGSLAIDNGDPDGAPALDQRGIARDAFPDIGAFEYVAP